jgi:hypothetical protein
VSDLGIASTAIFILRSPFNKMGGSGFARPFSAEVSAQVLVVPRAESQFGLGAVSHSRCKIDHGKRTAELAAWAA